MNKMEQIAEKYAEQIVEGVGDFYLTEYVKRLVERAYMAGFKSGCEGIKE